MKKKSALKKGHCFHCKLIHEENLFRKEAGFSIVGQGLLDLDGRNSQKYLHQT